MDYSLIIPAFISGILTFLAPCTLPLLPGYLGFISGVSVDQIKNNQGFRPKILLNALFYVLGFSLVFISLGGLFGLGGAALGKYRPWLARLGGIFVIFFGLYLLNVIKLPLTTFLNQERRFSIGYKLKPGSPFSSFLFGATFAFGWTPCVGPILGTVLILASNTGTLSQGVFLLSIFAAGLAIPFLLTALLIGVAFRYLQKLHKYLHVISVLGGVLLIIIGLFLLTGNFGRWISLFYGLFRFINYDKILNYL